MITVVSATGYKIDQHAKAIALTRAALPVKSKGLLISPQKPTIRFDGEWAPLLKEWIPRGTWSKIERPKGEFNLWEYSLFMLHGLIDYIDTDHCIVCQSDGYGLNPSKWKDEFLNWDYIGAPWPEWMNTGRVGNGGLSLRSRRWIAHAAYPLHAPPFDVPEVHGSEDCYFCTIYRDFYVSKGLTIAPLEVSSQFSIEHPIEEFPNRTSIDTWGFHGTFTPSTRNLPIK